MKINTRRLEWQKQISLMIKQEHTASLTIIRFELLAGNIRDHFRRDLMSKEIKKHTDNWVISSIWTIYLAVFICTARFLLAVIEAVHMGCE